MKISELLAEGRSILGGTWYHGGANFTNFSSTSIGSGEGNHLLGRGIYFSNSKDVATGYLKYPKTNSKALYTVGLRFTGLVYESGTRLSAPLKIALDGIARELGMTSANDLYDFSGRSNMRDGRGYIGGVFAASRDTQSALLLLKKFKIQGQYERLYGDVYEISVFDTDVIVIKDKEVTTTTNTSTAPTNTTRRVVSGTIIAGMKNRLQNSKYKSEVGAFLVAAESKLSRITNYRDLAVWLKSITTEKFSSVMRSNNTTVIGIDSDILATIVQMAIDIDVDVNLFDYDQGLHDRSSMLEISYQYQRRGDLNILRRGVSSAMPNVNRLIQVIATS